MLTGEQLGEFRARGFVHVRGVIGRESNGFEDFVWSCLQELHGIRKEDPDSWDVPGAWVGLKEFRDAAILQSIGSDKLCSAVDDLLGEGKWRKPPDWGGFLVSFPDTRRGEWYIPNDGWHVDAHFTFDPGVLFGVRVFTFLSHVEPRAGGTMVVAGSHRIVADYVSGLSEKEKEAGYRKVSEKFQRSDPWLIKLTQGDPRDPRRLEDLTSKTSAVGDVEVRVDEFCGKPGDVVLMHPWLLHVRAPHSGTHPRFMLAKYIYPSSPAAN